MTETRATSADGPAFPPGRYGRRRDGRGRPWLRNVALLLALAALVLVSLRLYTLYGDPAYDGEVITYQDVTDRQIVVTFQVTVPAGGTAQCVLRARSRDGAEVAREVVRVTAAPGERVVRVRHTLITSARPFIGELVRCRPGDDQSAG